MTHTNPRAAAADADHWKTRYEQERERLVKLWVAYKAMEAELQAREAATRAA